MHGFVAGAQYVLLGNTRLHHTAGVETMVGVWGWLVGPEEQPHLHSTIPGYVYCEYSAFNSVTSM